MVRHIVFVTELPKGEFVSIFVGFIRFENVEATVYGLKHWYRMLRIKSPPFIMWIHLSWTCLQSFSSIRPQTPIYRSCWSRIDGISRLLIFTHCGPHPDRPSPCPDRNSRNSVFALQGPVRTPRTYYAQKRVFSGPRSRVWCTDIYTYPYRRGKVRIFTLESSWEVVLRESNCEPCYSS